MIGSRWKRPWGSVTFLNKTSLLDFIAFNGSYKAMFLYKVANKHCITDEVQFNQ